MASKKLEDLVEQLESKKNAENSEDSDLEILDDEPVDSKRSLSEDEDAESDLETDSKRQRVDQVLI